MFSSQIRRATTAVAPKRSYNLAITRALPDSFADALSHHAADEPISMDRARQQHADYVAALRQILPVLQLDALPDFPDSVFVEDTVVAVGKRRVLLTQPGHVSRRGEVASIQEVLSQLGITEMTDMRLADPDAFCDGGDVLCTGRHVFVGLSHRTNQPGAQVLQQAFGDENVVVVPPTMQGDSVLHLKSAVTHLDDNTLLAPTGAAGDVLLESLQATARGYFIVRVPDVLACNVVSANGTILAQDTACAESRATLEAAAQDRAMNLVWVDTSELAKKDAALTCCSVLLDV